MTEVDKKGLEDFVSTGRTGRRNALPDITDDRISKGSGTACLPAELGKLSCKGTENGRDIREIFNPNFLVILKRTLQNFKKIRIFSAIGSHCFVNFLI